MTVYPIDAKTERFEAVEILGVPSLFTAGRVDRKTTPPGMYAYDMQTSEDDWSQPCLLARGIMVEHYGTVLTASPIALPHEGYLDLKPGDFHQPKEYENLTVADFEDKYLSPHPTQGHRHQAKARSAPAR